jgi:hypothetical protein
VYTAVASNLAQIGKLTLKLDPELNFLPTVCKVTFIGPISTELRPAARQNIRIFVPNFPDSLSRIMEIMLTYLLTYLLHGAESLRSQLVLQHIHIRYDSPGQGIGPSHRPVHFLCSYKLLNKFPLTNSIMYTAVASNLAQIDKLRRELDTELNFLTTVCKVTFINPLAYTAGCETG